MISQKWRLAAFLTIGLFWVVQAIGVPALSQAGGGPAGHGHGKAARQNNMAGKGQGVSVAVKKDGNSIIITMDALHANGGTPPGWRFRVPAGDPEEGRDVFVKMECFSCHHIGGEKFPAQDKDPASVGPDLTGMGSMHGNPAYFFESIVNPGRVIVNGPGYIKNGRFIMPSYSDSIGLQEAIDLVAYLMSLKGGHKDGGKRAPGNSGSIKMAPGHGGGMKLHGAMHSN